MENILPNGCCFADVMTRMHRAFLTIPLVLCVLHSPFHSNDDVIIIHSFDDNQFAIGRERRLDIRLEWQKMTTPMYIPRKSLKVQSSDKGNIMNVQHVYPSNETLCEMAEENQTASRFNC